MLFICKCYYDYFRNSENVKIILKEHKVPSPPEKSNSITDRGQNSNYISEPFSLTHKYYPGSVIIPYLF